MTSWADTLKEKSTCSVVIAIKSSNREEMEAIATQQRKQCREQSKLSTRMARLGLAFKTLGIKLRAFTSERGATFPNYSSI